MKRFHKILFATDFSESSFPAFDEALAIAKDEDATLTIAHVYEPPNVAETVALPQSAYDRWENAVRQEALAKLQPYVDEAIQNGIAADPLLLSGVPEEAISAAANDRPFDLVVLGTHGRKGLARLCFGSVASRVISTALCPVMTILAG
jgi:nucleotide-binding universal stress UspA family protein